MVAVGYGDVRRKDLTGSVAKADMSEIIKIPVTTLHSRWEGVLPAYRCLPRMDWEITSVLRSGVLDH